MSLDNIPRPAAEKHVRQRCAINKFRKGASCHMFTTRGPLCKSHGVEVCRLRVEISNISGLGLFAAMPVGLRKADWKRKPVFREGDTIDEYVGCLINRKQLEELEARNLNTYVMKIYSGVYTDAAPSTSCFSRYANDPRGTEHKANATFYTEDRPARFFGRPRKQQNISQTVLLVADQDIFDGDEIFVKYGSSYWGDPESESESETETVDEQ